jgi:hypothetical protein
MGSDDALTSWFDDDFDTNRVPFTYDEETRGIASSRKH